MQSCYVYILTNANKKVLYVGLTTDLAKRVLEHKEKLVKGFSSRYNLNKLIYYEFFDDFDYALEREKKIKKWKRIWKENIINEFNPNWKDLYDEVTLLLMRPRNGVRGGYIN